MVDISGTPGNDRLTGSAQNDSIIGGDGNDIIRGQGGDDTILGGIGDDTISGNGGNDQISGGAGNDRIDGGFVNAATPENDTIDGGEGNDTIEANIGDDLVLGGEGDDSIDGGDNNDTIDGGDGADRIRGGLGDDSVDGAAGNDTLFGSAGDDTLRGGDGEDLIYGGSPNANSQVVSNDVIDGGLGNDTIYAGAGDDSVLGGKGDDILRGELGSDTLDGGTGDDLLDGGAGVEADTLNGGDGFDTFVAGSTDTITDFNIATGQVLNDGDQTNNDFVDMSGYYNAANLATVNAAREAQGLQPYATPLGWMRADQEDDGQLDDINTANGFGQDFVLNIKKGGTPVTGADLTTDNTNVVCFAADTLIETDAGPVRAGDLSVGDLVRTRDAGLQPVRWTGQRHFDAAALDAAPKLRPIRIGKGSLGDNTPAADLIVSPQHRVLLRSRIAQRMFGTTEVLVAAKQLCQVEGIDIATDLDRVIYVHFLLDDHQIVYANGAETESLYTGAEALKSVGPAARDEIFAIFPDLRDTPAPVAARQLTSGRSGRKLVTRHISHRRPLVASIHPQD